MSSQSLIIAVVVGGVLGFGPAVAPAWAGVCETASQVAQSVSISSQDASALQSDVQWAPGPEHDRLSLAQTKRVSGACADRVSRFDGASLVFSNDVVLTLTPDRAAPTANPSLFLEVQREAAFQGEAPRMADHVFLGGRRMDQRRDARGGLEVDYLGAWRGPKSSVVAMFTRRADGTLTAPTPLLFSTLPLRSASYSPDLDSASGTIWLAQEDRAGLRLAGVRWSRPRAAP